MKGFDFRNHDNSIVFNHVELEPGEVVHSHKHDYPHDAFILRGRVRFAVGPISRELEGPDTVHFPGGAVHSFTAVTAAELVITHPADKVPQ